jgi:antitoxin component of MazEF toxin-antitoxin module
MTGVAAERILIVWRDVTVASITEDNRKRKLIEATESQTAKRIYEAVNNRIDPIREQLPVELQESVGTELEGVFQVVGRTHNDAGQQRRGIVIQLKVRKFGNSLGVVLPKEVIGRLHTGGGQRLFLIEAAYGDYRLTPYDPRFEKKVAKAEQIMARYRNTLHTLGR